MKLSLKRKIKPNTAAKENLLFPDQMLVIKCGNCYKYS